MRNDQDWTPARYGASGRRIKLLRGALTLWIGLIVSVWAGGAAAQKPPTLLLLGDSLTSGWGLDVDAAFPAQFAAALRRGGRAAWRVVNAGVAGDTTAGGRARLAWSLAERPDAVLVELGANDGLRGIEPAETRRNLDAILAELKRRNIPVLLAGMYAPPNLGREYGKSFNAIFPALAKKHGVALYPFFLDGVAAQPGLNQPDGIHPNKKGVAVIVDRILPYVMKILP